MLAASIVGNPILTCWSLMELSGHVSRWNGGEMSQTQHMDLLSSPPICLLHLFICRDSRIPCQKQLEKVRAPIQQKLFSLTVPTPWLCPAMKKGRSAPRVCRKWRNALRRSWYATSKACHGSKNPKRKVGVSFSGPSLFKGYLGGYLTNLILDVAIINSFEWRMWISESSWLYITSWLFMEKKWTRSYGWNLANTSEYPIIPIFTISMGVGFLPSTVSLQSFEGHI